MDATDHELKEKASHKQTKSNYHQQRKYLAQAGYLSHCNMRVFTLDKGGFHDTSIALCLKYGWCPLDLPSACLYGKHFTLEHAQNRFKF